MRLKRSKPKPFDKLSHAEQVAHARAMIRQYQNGPDRHTSGGQTIVRRWLDWLTEHGERT